MKYWPIILNEPLFGIDVPENINVDFLVTENIAEVYKKSFDVKRYNYEGYPKDIFNDSAGNHTQRCIKLAWQRVFYDVLEKKKLAQILLLHDLPEVGPNKSNTSDVSIVAKENDVALKAKVDQEELKTAKGIFDGEQFKLFEEFNKASVFLDGQIEYSENMLPEAIYARIVEQADGNAFFHFIWAIWAESDDYDKNFKMPEKAVAFTGAQLQKFREQLKKITNNDLRYECEKLLGEQEKFVKECWTTLYEKSGKDKIPNEIVANPFFGIN